MKPASRLTLTQLFIVITVTAAITLGVTFYAVLESSRRSILTRSETLRADTARQISARLSSELGAAIAALKDVESAIRFDALRADDPDAVESRLFSELLDHPTLSDVTLTHAVLLGHQPNGDPALAPSGRWQISVFRASAEDQSEILTRRTSMEADAFASHIRHRPRAGSLWSGTLHREAMVEDPTRHATFETTISPRLYGRAIWSDLSYSELDAALPAPKRRVVVTVQKAVEDASGLFAGVVRVGLRTQTIDALSGVDPRDPAERVFLCDRQGRLIARADSSDRLLPAGDDLRFASTRLRPELAAALDRLQRHQLSSDEPERSERIVAGDIRFLVTYLALDNSQEWVAVRRYDEVSR